MILLWVAFGVCALLGVSIFCFGLSSPGQDSPVAFFSFLFLIAEGILLTHICLSDSYVSQLRAQYSGNKGIYGTFATGYTVITSSNEVIYYSVGLYKVKK